ncbi:DUF3999 domain-containing protein [Pseudomonas sp. LPB0260]|uniref:DUF3999 domain-containing protein n=1 Tax=Pseudomonas sp. LPB0260 TaxID=2614442 RepID=UPI0015C1EDFE|nr:DUF3999 domain-containing protein [Pseudomonas sp. LPB0260]QLC73447.1 DUF3999 domain-containing protein [Pseudomonas sp. LPB0260]QLC76221.1 DUF3999 domain-containing protein [Pseudomonas sp. LPB0260]
MNTKTRPGAWLLLSGLLCSLAAAAAEHPADYTWHLPLQLNGEGPWYRLELPMAAHLAARHGDLRDLRVFNGEGEALAYALVRSPHEERLDEQDVRWFPLYAEGEGEAGLPGLRVERSASGTLIELLEADAAPSPASLRGWLLDASAVEQPLVRLTLDWSSDQEGFQRFRIEASDDLRSWRSWGHGQLARLSFANEYIEQRQVELPGRRARYLRLLWESPQQAPQLIAARLFSRPHDSLSLPLVWSEPMPADRAADGAYQWRLPLALPVQRIRLELGTDNRLVPVQVSGRGGAQGRWRPLGGGLLYHMPEQGGELRQDELALAGLTVQQLRLQVDQRGGGLAPEPRLQVGVRATRLVFLLRGSPPYRLALGNPDALSAALPVQALIPGYRPERLAQLGVAEVSPGATPQAASPADGTVDWQRWGLWAVLLLGVAVLALMAVSLLRKAPEA